MNTKAPENTENKRTGNAVYTFLALIVMALWGSLFACVKLGYRTFGIDTSSVADIIMFASMRFTVCGAVMCFAAAVSRAKLEKPVGKNVLRLVFVGIFAIVLHYAFLYVGLTMTDSSKTALLKQTGPLLYACFAFLFVKSEKFSVYKIIAALVGFCGIVAINFGNPLSSFAVGDLLILAASVCSVISMMLSERSSGNSPVWITGISQLSGGIIMLAAAKVMGAEAPSFTAGSTPIFVYICAASITGYTLFYFVQRKIKLSTLSVIKFSEPLFACVFGAVLLGEDILKLRYLVAFVLITASILLARRDTNIGKKGEAYGNESKHS